MEGDAPLEIPQTREKCYVAIWFCVRNVFEQKNNVDEEKVNICIKECTEILMRAKDNFGYISKYNKIKNLEQIK